MDRPLIRHHRSVREDDQWMLDRWSPPSSHRVRVVYCEHHVPDSLDVWRDYRTECACGWRSVPSAEAVILEPCPVGLALADRDRRKPTTFERVEWFPLDTP